MELTEQEIERYSRHIILQDVGGKGQLKLKRAKILLIGAGGLGSPAGLYLAAAGIGTIGLVDGDVVDLSNLQRQIMHSTATLGQPKVESGRKTLSAINPEITINAYHQLVNAENILPLISQYDIVLDGSDNFTTRFLVNDACFFAKKTLISASMFRFEGQLTTIATGAGTPSNFGSVNGVYRRYYLPNATDDTPTVIDTGTDAGTGSRANSASSAI